MVKTITAADARASFAEITDDVTHNNTEYLITKNGKEVARLVPPFASGVITEEFAAHVEEFMNQYADDLQELASL